VPGNVTTCDEAGFPDATQIESPSAPGNGDTTSDGVISGTVLANAGPIDPGHGQVLNVTLLAPLKVAKIEAVIVKGGVGRSPSRRVWSSRMAFRCSRCPPGSQLTCRVTTALRPP
jgi:hypothetical protein